MLCHKWISICGCSPILDFHIEFCLFPVIIFFIYFMQLIWFRDVVPVLWSLRKAIDIGKLCDKKAILEGTSANCPLLGFLALISKSTKIFCISVSFRSSFRVSKYAYYEAIYSGSPISKNYDGIITGIITSSFASIAFYDLIMPTLYGCVYILHARYIYMGCLCWLFCRLTINVHVYTTTPGMIVILYFVHLNMSSIEQYIISSLEFYVAT